MQMFALRTGWFWSHVVARLLGSAVPGADILFRGDSEMFERMQGREDLASLFSAGYAWAGLASVQVWVWAAAGLAMIVVAIRLRRWRVDACACHIHGVGQSRAVVSIGESPTLASRLS